MPKLWKVVDGDLRSSVCKNPMFIRKIDDKSRYNEPRKFFKLRLWQENRNIRMMPPKTKRKMYIPIKRIRRSITLKLKEKLKEKRATLLQAEENVASDPSSPIVDVASDSSTHINNVANDPSTRIVNVASDPSTPNVDVASDSSTHINNVANDPSTGIVNVVSDPSTHMADVASDPSTHINNVDSKPLTRMDDAISDDVASDPVIQDVDVANVPLTHMADVASDPSTHINNVDSEPLTRMDDAISDDVASDPVNQDVDVANVPLTHMAHVASGSSTHVNNVASDPPTRMDDAVSDHVASDPLNQEDDIANVPLARMADVVSDPSAHINNVASDPPTRMDDSVSDHVASDPPTRMDDAVSDHVASDPLNQEGDIANVPLVHMADVVSDPSTHINNLATDPSTHMEPPIITDNAASTTSKSQFSNELKTVSGSPILSRNIARRPLKLFDSHRKPIVPSTHSDDVAKNDTTQVVDVASNFSTHMDDIASMPQISQLPNELITESESPKVTRNITKILRIPKLFDNHRKPTIVMPLPIERPLTQKQSQWISKSEDESPKANKISLSPFSKQISYQEHLNKHNYSIGLFPTDSESEISDNESRLLASKEQFTTNKVESNRLNKKKEIQRQKSQERSLREQIKAYDEYIAQLTQDLEEGARQLSQSTLSTSFGKNSSDLVDDSQKLQSAKVSTMDKKSQVTKTSRQSDICVISPNMPDISDLPELSGVSRTNPTPSTILSNQKSNNNSTFDNSQDLFKSVNLKIHEEVTWASSFGVETKFLDEQFRKFEKKP